MNEFCKKRTQLIYETLIKTVFLINFSLNVLATCPGRFLEMRKTAETIHTDDYERGKDRWRYGRRNNNWSMEWFFSPFGSKCFMQKKTTPNLFYENENCKIYLSVKSVIKFASSNFFFYHCKNSECVSIRIYFLPGGMQTTATIISVLDFLSCIE